MKYEEIDFKEALRLHAEGETVYYTYHTSPTAYHYIGSLGLDHARRNQRWYKYYLGVKSLWDKLDDPNTLVNAEEEEAWENGIFHVGDVIEAVDFIIKDMWNHSNSACNFLKERIEIYFGKELLEKRKANKKGINDE